MTIQVDPNKPRILVALGGRSSEREVSIKSGANVVAALENLKYQVGILDTGTGRLMQPPEIANLQKDPAKLPSVINFPLIDIARHFSLVFIALHGKFGEDGGLQGILEEIGVPYVGSNPSASAVAMNKKFSKYIFQAKQIPTAEFEIISQITGRPSLAFPLVVKPAASGSSLGVAICTNEADYKIAIKNALEHSREAIVEKYIAGRELTVAIIENEKGEKKALPVIEIKPQTKFFDFKSKYNGSTQEIVPAKISEKLSRSAQDLAIKTYNALGCRHFARVDMIADKNDKLFVLEANTIPGLTSESLLPKAAKAAGISFEDLIDHLVQTALRQSIS